MPSSEPSSDRPAASLREAQGRLFWAWLFTLPILLILGASRVFGAPWPDELLQDLAMLALAFPVLFVVGLPLFHLERTGSTGPDRERARWTALDRLVATLATIGYLTGVTALAGWTRDAAGPAALLVATYLTARHLWGRPLC